VSCHGRGDRPRPERAAQRVYLDRTRPRSYQAQIANRRAHLDLQTGVTGGSRGAMFEQLHPGGDADAVVLASHAHGMRRAIGFPSGPGLADPQPAGEKSHGGQRWRGRAPGDAPAGTPGSPGVGRSLSRPTSTQARPRLLVELTNPSEPPRVSRACPVRGVCDHPCRRWMRMSGTFWPRLAPRLSALWQMLLDSISQCQQDLGFRRREKNPEPVPAPTHSDFHSSRSGRFINRFIFQSYPQGLHAVEVGDNVAHQGDQVGGKRPRNSRSASRIVAVLRTACSEFVSRPRSHASSVRVRRTELYRTAVCLPSSVRLMTPLPERSNTKIAFARDNRGPIPWTLA
jgi:hypothetical protein